MNKWHDVSELPDEVVYVLVEDTETGKVWQPLIGLYDYGHKKWMDSRQWILEFDRFRVIAWKKL